MTRPTSRRTTIGKLGLDDELSDRSDGVLRLEVSDDVLGEQHDLRVDDERVVPVGHDCDAGLSLFTLDSLEELLGVSAPAGRADRRPFALEDAFLLAVYLSEASGFGAEATDGLQNLLNSNVIDVVAGKHLVEGLNTDHRKATHDRGGEASTFRA